MHANNLQNMHRKVVRKKENEYIVTDDADKGHRILHKDPMFENNNVPYNRS